VKDGPAAPRLVRGYYYLVPLSGGEREPRSWSREELRSREHLVVRVDYA